jgi:trk system potassium uptake protein TrkH
LRGEPSLTVKMSINEVAKGLLCFTMLLGRLEIFTLLVLFTPMFWRI